MLVRNTLFVRHTPLQANGKELAQSVSPNEIRAALVLRGIKVKDIADQVGIVPQAVSMVISGRHTYKGYRIRPFIAAALGRTVEEIWPTNMPGATVPHRGSGVTHVRPV